VTLVDDVKQLREVVHSVQELAEANRAQLERTEEQINGTRGLSVAITQLAAEVQSLRKAAYWLAALIVASSIGFAFSVLTFLQ
jgi:hypothetical protein